MAAIDRQNGIVGAPPLSAWHVFNITPSDTVDLPYVTNAINVGVAGNVKLTDQSGATDVFALPVGQFQVRATRIWAASTTATGIIGMVV